MRLFNWLRRRRAARVRPAEVSPQVEPAALALPSAAQPEPPPARLLAAYGIGDLELCAEETEALFRVVHPKDADVAGELVRNLVARGEYQRLARLRSELAGSWEQIKAEGRGGWA
jgi:hypothetical protein